MPRTPRKSKSKSSGVKEPKQQQQAPQQQSHVTSIQQDDEEENSTDSVEQAARESAMMKDDNMFDQDSLMFEEVDDVELPQDEEDYDVTGRGVDEMRTSGAHASSPDALLGDEVDSTLNTPFGSPLSAFSGYSSIQKWTGDLKKMLLDDHQESETRTKGWVFPLPQVLPSISSAGRSESFMEQEGYEGDFDVMPTTEELAEKYSNELIEKEKSILQRDSKILELERAYRDIKNNLEDCQKELKQKTETATSGVEKLKQSLDEKDRCIMETSEKLRKVTESYNSSEKRWKEQQDYLEKQIQKLKADLDCHSNLGEELERLTKQFKKETAALEELLEKAKEETLHLKQQFSQDKAHLEEQLKSLQVEKLNLEEQLQEEIRLLEDKLMLSEQACETALCEKESIRIELETQEEKNRTLISDIDELKEKREEIMQRQQNEKQALENEIETLNSEKKRLEDDFSNEKYELELQVQTLSEQLQLQRQDQTQADLITSLMKEKEDLQEKVTNEKFELELHVQSLKEQLVEAKRHSEEVENAAPINFFTQSGTDIDAPNEDWLETKQSMENKIAELELEKGNLLLQLVDVDDGQQGVKEEIVESSKVTENLALAQQNLLEQEIETSKQALQEAQSKITLLEEELEESKQRDRERIESAMNTIAWEEKVDTLQKHNDSLLEELQVQRQSADMLSSRYEDLEKKYAELEAGQPPIEALVEIDKCDGWSDDSPQLPPEQDEGFTEDPQIAELKEALEEKQREINEFLQKQLKMEYELDERNRIMARYEAMVVEMEQEKSTYDEKFNEITNELERVKKELIEKEILEQIQPQTVTIPQAITEGWGDDETPIILDDESSTDQSQQISEIKEELSKKTEELSASNEKCRSLEDKLKKAMKAIKAKNDKLSELKNRLGEDSMNMSTVSVVETSVAQQQPVPVQEPLVTKSVAYECGEVEALKKECQEKSSKISELEIVVKSLQEQQLQAQAPVLHLQDKKQELYGLISQRDEEIAKLRNELHKMTISLDIKNDEFVHLFNNCDELQKLVDERAQQLDECTANKDEEVRQAISQYEDMLKAATLNVSHLTNELEERRSEIDILQGQLQEAQEHLLTSQNENKAFRQDAQNVYSNLGAKEQELEGRRQLEEQLRQELSILQGQLNELNTNQAAVTETLDRSEAEKTQLREEYVCLQNEYGSKNRELQMQISQMIDQLNERESAISVMETRLKESDEQSEKLACEIRRELEEKSKSLEQMEQTVFIKTEECLRLEERLKDSEETSKAELDMKIQQLEEQHRSALENFVAQNSEDLERTCEQLAKKNQEVVELQSNYNLVQQQVAQLEQDYGAKCTELGGKDQALLEVDSLRATITSLEDALGQWSQAYNGISTELNARNVEIQNLKDICNQYEEKIYNATMSQDEIQQKIQKLEGTLAQCQQDSTNYCKELQDSKMEVERFQKTDQEYKELIDKLNAELRESKAEVQRCSSDIENMSNQLSRQQEVEGSLNKYLEDLNGATEELGKKNNEIREMEKIVQTQETQLQTLQSSVDSLRKEILNKDEMMEEKDEQVSKLEAEVWEMTALKEKEGSISKHMEELQADLEEKTREISDLRFELDEGILQEKVMKKKLEEKEQENQAMRYEINNKDQSIAELHAKIEEISSRPIISQEDEPIAQRLQSAEEEKQMLERKIDLLQSKLSEVEESEVKCVEDFSKLKILRTELEMDNLRMSAELEQLRISLHIGDSDPKYKAMEHQIVLMSKTLEDRDKLCKSLMKDISELQQAHDAMQIRVNDLQTHHVPPQYYEGSLEATVLDQDRQIFSLRIDIDREKKIRELYEGLLFLAASKRQFETSNVSNRSGGGGWFGLGDLFGTSASTLPTSPPRHSSPPPRSRAPSMMGQQYLAPQQYISGGPPSLPFTSTPSRPLSPVRPVTPITPAAPFTPPVFDSPIGQQLPPPTQVPLQVPTMAPLQFGAIQENQPEFSLPSNSPLNSALDRAVHPQQQIPIPPSQNLPFHHGDPDHSGSSYTSWSWLWR